VTKLDGTSKGGTVVAIQKELGLPIKFIGFGEQADDLQPFDAKQFVQALFEESIQFFQRNLPRRNEGGRRTGAKNFHHG
jgi:flagellar biosynthesis GTPase FlhF